MAAIVLVATELVEIRLVHESEEIIVDVAGCTERVLYDICCEESPAYGCGG